ncbi:DUF3085 domain-containing protein [Ralstonia pseudosolanacearum]|uniref:DUF3085 domain-containing protein n=1 Tax=Ralstonia pseudosolanacearum TaxID=1310165 RepID=UPI0040549D07
MALRFKNADLRAVLLEASARQTRVVLVKDQGVYFLAEHGERLPNGTQKLIAYAVGCNPNVDAFDDWWGRAKNELGGDDFAEYFNPQTRVFAHIRQGDDDLELSASPTHLQLKAAPAAPDKKYR